MAAPQPGIGDWYRQKEGGDLFEVVAFDDDDGTIEIQYFDGTVEEMDVEDWDVAVGGRRARNGGTARRLERLGRRGARQERGRGDATVSDERDLRASGLEASTSSSSDVAVDHLDGDRVVAAELPRRSRALPRRSPCALSNSAPCDEHRISSRSCVRNSMRLQVQRMAARAGSDSRRPTPHRRMRTRKPRSGQSPVPIVKPRAAGILMSARRQITRSVSISRGHAAQRRASSGSHPVAQQPHEQHARQADAGSSRRSRCLPSAMVREPARGPAEA